MKWPEKTSSGPVTISYLQERRVPLRWQEVVALGLEIAEVFERSGKKALPREQNLELTQGGTVKFLRGRTHSGSPVSALARTLSSILPKDRPTQLRLVLSTAGPDSASSKSMSEFVEALKYFERPGRLAVLSEVHQRALEMPLATESEETDAQAVDGVPRQRQRPRWLVPAAAMLVLASVGLASVSVYERTAPGKLTDRLEAIRVAATGVWGRMMDETAWMREAAAEDLSNVVDKVKEVTNEVKDAANERLSEDGETPEAESAAEGPRVSRREVARPKPPSTDRADVPAPLAAKHHAPDVIQTEPAVDVVVFGGEGSGSIPENGNAHLMASVLFDSSDINVTPPVTLRLHLPNLGERDPRNMNAGVVEAIVSEVGEVEKVRLVSPPESIHQSMILSAIKTWRFRPARRDGTAVRYRHLIPVAIPR